ncbi:MAG TPA: hypothetical protein VHO47_00085 [Candidatus Babeliales bacterium]|nr:hypothetical protein [Candidatus Babeliales bacterium]
MKFRASILIMLGFVFSGVKAMENSSNLEELAEQAHAPAIIRMASKKGIKGELEEALELLQRYHILVAQGDACCTDKSLGENAFAQIELFFAKPEQKLFVSYVKKLPQQEYNKLFIKQLEWAEGRSTSGAPLPEPKWLLAYSSRKKNKKNLFIQPSEWHDKRAEIIKELRSSLG